MASASCRAEVCRVRPVARRARSWAKSPAAIAMSGGQPSTTQPIAGPCDSPKVVTRNRCPNVFKRTLPFRPRRSKQRASRLCHARLAGGGQLADARVVLDPLGAFDRKDAHLPDLELDTRELDVRQQLPQPAPGIPDLPDHPPAPPPHPPRPRHDSPPPVP